jgi:GAF domain-containing protein
LRDRSREILVASAHALAHEDEPGSILTAMLDAVARAFGVGSAAIVADRSDGTGLEIIASFGLDKRAAAGLSEAIARPSHPIARTFADPTPTYDVTPVNPGGPKLRSHLPLTVTRCGRRKVVGVLALAHENSIDAEDRAILEAVANLAAVAIEREGSRAR